MLLSKRLFGEWEAGPSYLWPWTNLGDAGLHSGAKGLNVPLENHAGPARGPRPSHSLAPEPTVEHSCTCL